MGENKSLLSRVVTWVVIGVLAVLALKILGRLLAFVFGLVGSVLGIAAFLLFTVAPILLVGWLVVKGWQAFTRKPSA